MSENPEESLLMRWSRRKLRARQETRHDAREDVAQAEVVKLAARDDTARVANSAAAEQTEALTEAEAEGVGDVAASDVDIESLPDIETLTYDSDFSVFLREGVPERLKQAALRKLWLSDAVFANLDGLNDYDPQTMKFLEETIAEPIGEIGRGLRDKIMDAKRAREERPRGRRGPSAQERRAAAERARNVAPEQIAEVGEGDDDIGVPDANVTKERRDN